VRIIVATVPLTGHVNPMLLVVRALVARGHQVIWYAAKKFAPAIEAAGARFAPMRAAHDWDDADVEQALPALRGTRGLTRVKLQLREMFIAPMAAQLRDLEELLGEQAPAVILADQAHLGAALLSEKHGLPWTGLGISALVIPSVDTAPFGAARPPAKNDVDRKIYRFISWIINRWVFRSVHRAYREGRVAAGLPAGEATYFDVLAPDLFLQPTIPSFEYPRSDLPPQVRFIGPLVPRAEVSEASGAASSLPAWWPELAAARAAGRPVILVTQGTLATDPRELIRPALRGLAEEDVLVVATTSATPAELGMAAWPANARVARFIPYQALLPHVSVLVTNGGYGGVQMALGHGVPMVVAGGSEEKPEIAARVAWAGVGIDVRTGRPSAKKVRRAVLRVLGEPSLAARARALAEECARHEAPSAAATLIEQLGARAATRESPEAA
jgi:UDP:flavonoid glycosyltransferase YjiC (YdhE family)